MQIFSHNEERTREGHDVRMNLSHAWFVSRSQMQYITDINHHHQLHNEAEGGGEWGTVLVLGVIQPHDRCPEHDDGASIAQTVVRAG